MRAAGANENARYLCKCVGLIDGMKHNDEIDHYTSKQFSVCLNLGINGLNVSDCEFCRPGPPPRTRGGLQI